MYRTSKRPVRPIVRPWPAGGERQSEEDDDQNADHPAIERVGPHEAVGILERRINGLLIVVGIGDREDPACDEEQLNEVLEHEQNPDNRVRLAEDAYLWEPPRWPTRSPS